ncbi:carph-isopro domain-containing protein [Sphingobium xenophagum]|uniref:carph-isopro domain-containing protein n=1 Tax=Sphingobium xenophagum TaxID=121428 RepID=UPI00351F12A2
MQNAAEIVEALGGTVAVAKALDIAPTTVSSWKTAGRIPSWRMPVIRALAEKCAVSLSDNGFSPTAASPPNEAARAFPTD